MKNKLKISVSKFDEEDLQSLALFESDDLAISFYLKSQIGNEPWGKIKNEISSVRAEGRRLISEVAIEKKKKADVTNKFEKAVDYLNTFEIPGGARSLAIFMGGGEARIITLPFFVERDIKLKRIYHTRPIVEALSRQNPYAVLSVSRTQGRITIIERGEIKEAGEIVRDDVPRKTKSGEEERSGFGTGGARSHDLRSKKIDRHIEWHLEKHIEKVTRDLFNHFWRKYKFKYLLVESHDDLKGKIEKELHPYLKPEIKVLWHTKPNENLDYVRKKGEEYFASIKAEEDKKIVANIIESLGVGGQGVSGADETLDQLNRQMLDIIYISHNFKMDGYYTVRNGEVMIYANKGLISHEEKIFALDIIDAVCRKAVLTNTKIRFIEKSEELDKIGGIAGLLKNY